MSRFNYNDEDMQKAIEAVKKGSPVATASKTFKVPRMTLSDKCRGKTPIHRKMGPSSILSDIEEKNLVRWICHLGTRGFPVTSCQLLDSVQMLLKSQNKPNPFVNDRPRRHWLKAFQRRHPDITTRVSQNLTKSRASVSETNIRRWFEEITEYFRQNDMLDVCSDPSRVFNCDETAFFLSPGNNRVLVKKGQKMVHSVTNSDEKENITTLVMGNAEGDLAPPMVVVNLKRVPKSLADSMPQSWAIGRSENGWMTGQTFYEYISNIFHPWLVEKNVTLPVILYLDGHASHLTLPLSEFCKDIGIEIVALYPNSTHFLQPMDVAVFHPLKVAWKKEVYKWRIENAGVRLKRDNFSLLLHNVLKNTFKPEMLKNGFRACGLVPLNPNALDYFKLKNKKENAAITKPLINVQDIKNHITYIESFIPQEKLRLFKESGQTWLHEVEYTELFKLWHKINRSVSEEVTETVEEIQEDLTNSVDDEMLFDDVLNKILPENETVEFVVREGGTLEKITNEDLSFELNSPESSNAKSQRKSDLDKGVPINLGNILSEEADEPNTWSPEISCQLPVISTNQHYEATAKEAPNSVVQRDNLVDTTNELSLTTSEIDVPDVSIDVDPFLLSPSSAIQTRNENNIPENLSPTTTPLLSEISQKTLNESEKNAPMEENAETNKEKDILADIPSPFKNNLFWPDSPKVTKKLKEKIPSVATSKDWQEYFRKKENKKIEKEKEIQERKRKRLEEKENKKYATVKTAKKNKGESKKSKTQESESAGAPEKPENKGSWFCNICEEEHEEDMIKCQKCLQWMHERCASSSKKTKTFICQNCLSL